MEGCWGGDQGVGHKINRWKKASVMITKSESIRSFFLLRDEEFVAHLCVFLLNSPGTGEGGRFEFESSRAVVGKPGSGVVLAGFQLLLEDFFIFLLSQGKICKRFSIWATNTSR